MPAEDVAQRLPAPGTPERERGGRARARDHRARRDRRRRARGRHGDALRLPGQGPRARARRPRPELPRPQARRPDRARRRRHADDELRDARRAGRGGRGDRRPPGAATRIVALAADGSLFLDDDGGPSPHAPGHGDLGDALQLSGALERYRRAACARSSCATSTTSARRSTRRWPACTRARRRDHGGARLQAAGRRGGRARAARRRLVALAEAFRVPDDFPHERFPLFNTNTLWIDTRRSRRAPIPGAWPARTWTGARRSSRAARRRAHLVASVALRPRPSRRSQVRFVPVKDPDDLAAAQDQIAAICRERLGSPLIRAPPPVSGEWKRYGWCEPGRCPAEP